MPLVGPVAHKLGIDLIWFGVLLGVNMQTSFMHPPFGFALFYLRSVAPKEVKTSDIYWGAIPFVCIQVIMVALIIAYPRIVSVEKAVDMEEKLELKIDAPLAEPDAVKDDTDSTPELNFSTDGQATPDQAKPEAKKEEETTPALHFSTDADPKK